ncbi:MAG: hypothetical protein QXS20_00470 [Candidatus Thorarchaeota archaeon]
MSGLDSKSIDRLADMVVNVLWQDRLHLWSAIRQRLDTEGHDVVRDAFDGSMRRLLNGPMKDHLQVRWGMNLCMHCNDSNVEKNGIAFVAPNGDGLEFNQCLNCRVGLLYDIRSAVATLDTYAIGIGEPEQFGGVSFFWDALVPEEMLGLRPLYELVRQGRWLGSLSLTHRTPRFLPLERMRAGLKRSDPAIWSGSLPDDVATAVDSFMTTARDHIDVAMIL